MDGYVFSTQTDDPGISFTDVNIKGEVDQRLLRHGKRPAMCISAPLKMANSWRNVAL